MANKYSEKQRASRRKARNKYCRNTLIIKSVALNKNTDMDIVEYIGSLEETFSGYVHRLIREDKERKEKSL